MRERERERDIERERDSFGHSSLLLPVSSLISRDCSQVGPNQKGFYLSSERVVDNLVGGRILPLPS
jgi:hypothetical protein